MALGWKVIVGHAMVHSMTPMFLIGQSAKTWKEPNREAISSGMACMEDNGKAISQEEEKADFLDPLFEQRSEHGHVRLEEQAPSEEEHPNFPDAGIMPRRSQRVWKPTSRLLENFDLVCTDTNFEELALEAIHAFADDRELPRGVPMEGKSQDWMEAIDTEYAAHERNRRSALLWTCLWDLKQSPVISFTG